MLNFDERELINGLSTLSKRAQVAFAAAAASRQLCNYERYACKLPSEDILRPRKIASRLWIDLGSPSIDSALWSAMRDEVICLLTKQLNTMTVSANLADDALASLSYAIGSLLGGGPTQAALAARRAYEAVDQAAIKILRIQPGSSDAELAIKSHSLVQRELTRQRHDLTALRDQLLEEVRHRAWLDQILTSEEAALVAGITNT